MKYTFYTAILLTASLALISCSQPQTQTAQTTTQLSEKKAGPKNVILMVSDGIGFNGWLAADYYQGRAGQQSYQNPRPDGTKPVLLGLAHSALNLVDENGQLLGRGDDAAKAVKAEAQGYNPKTRWKKFENAMLNDFEPIAQSYTSYTDSAAAGTALMSGHKTSVGRVNMDWSGTQTFETIAQLAMASGRAAGAVSSVMVSHATPAAVIAHNASRNNYSAIFNEMVASDLDVIMGAGHPLYDSSGVELNADEQEYKFVGGKATYTQMTQEAGINGFDYIDAKADFEALAEGKILPERVLGIVRSGSTLQASRRELGDANTPSGMAFNQDVPGLATMSLGALNVLHQNDNGFFVMIEGGAVDWMGHANNMPRFIEEQVDFNAAVDAVIKWVEDNSNWDDTLLIITSDHECGGIWGEGTWTNSEGGPIAKERTDESLESARFNPEEDTFNDFKAVQDRGAGNIPGFQFASPNHTNDLVPLWAIGKGSDHFKQFTQTDTKAAELWGAPYGWDGNYVDNTSVFEVMKVAMGANAPW